MRIDNRSNNYSFCANIASPELKFCSNDFFIHIKGYGRNREWARTVKQTADNAVGLIRKQNSFEYVLKIITDGVKCANQFLSDRNKAFHTGILRCKRDGWFSGSDWSGKELCTNYSDIKRYKSYQRRLDVIAAAPLKNPFEDIELTVPKILDEEHYLKHASPIYINNAFAHISNIYKRITGNYNFKNIDSGSLSIVNDGIAEIRWIMAHSTPWERGSDAISNVFMRAVYKSLGVKSYPVKEGISLDMEAYCSELNDYKRNFTGYFEKPPVIID